MQEYIERFTDLGIQAISRSPTVVICQVTVVLFLMHLFNKEIKMQVAGAETNLTLRHRMTLAQGAEIMFKQYEGLDADDSSVMHINTGPKIDPLVMAIQNQGQAGNQDLNAYRLN